MLISYGRSVFVRALCVKEIEPNEDQNFGVLFSIYIYIYIYIDIIFGGLVLYSYWNKSDTKLLD
jgi:hypothetical protein